MITFREFNGLAICGEVNIPAGTKLKNSGEFIAFEDGRLVTRRYSDNYCKHFTRNDDGHGLERGRLTYAIAYSPRNNGDGCRLSEDEIEMIRRDWGKYLMPYNDTVLFNNDFYDAPIEDLRAIAAALEME